MEIENRIVFVSARDGQSDIYMMMPDGSDIVRITNDEYVDTNPVWSPERTHIAYTSYVPGESGLERSKIFIINADGTNQYQLFDDPGAELLPSWSPDGMQILFTNRSIYIGDIGGSSKLFHQDPDFFILRFPDWSPDGKMIAFFAITEYYENDEKHWKHEIRIMDSDGSNIRVLTEGESPAWSPDGKKIAYQKYIDGQYEIFVINVDGTGIQQLTNSPLWDISPDWSPDGKSIVFVSSRDEDLEIYVMNADGSNQVRLTNSQGEDMYPAWTK